MSRLALSGVLLVALGLMTAACDGGTTSTTDQPTGYFDSAGAPVVAPIDQNATSDSTAHKQLESGYFPSADAPLVSPDQVDANTGSTLQKQEKSGYFPDADAPLAPANTLGIR